MYSHPAVPWWAQARDLEALEGRARAEATWGTGYYREDIPARASPGIPARLDALERAINQLFALAAMEQMETTAQKSGDGLAARYRE